MKNKSFTLIETMIAIFVFTLILGGVCGLIITLYGTNRYSWDQTTAVEEARRGVQTMIKEIRSARDGEDGSYSIERADDKEIIFYSDIDGDGKAEKVRYFLAVVGTGSQTKECQTSSTGGSCSVNFSNFLTGALDSAQIKVYVDGDFGWTGREYAEIFADSQKIGESCRTSGCSDCPNSWQGLRTFDITSKSVDNNIQFLIDSTSDVGPGCPHAMKAKFEFSWIEDLSGIVHEFKKGVIEPEGSPATYPEDQEIVTILSSYVRNAPPIFEYFDGQGNLLVESPARLNDTKIVKVFLVVDVNPIRSPSSFNLESMVQLRNLKEDE